MDDIIDDAAEAADLFLKASLSKRAVPGPAATGECLNCGAPVPAFGQRWCDADCREDFEMRNARPRA
jgi:hypothetical protein